VGPLHQLIPMVISIWVTGNLTKSFQSPLVQRATTPILLTVSNARVNLLGETTRVYIYTPILLHSMQADHPLQLSPSMTPVLQRRITISARPRWRRLTTMMIWSNSPLHLEDIPKQ